MTTKVIIVGAGGHAAEIRDYVNHFNEANKGTQLEVIGFLDDDQDSYNHYGFKEPYLGKIDEHTIDPSVEYIMGIANLSFRKQLILMLQDKGAKFRGLIHPTAIISPSSEIDETTVISHNASVGAKVKIGAFNMLNSRCTIGHDSSIGSFNFISPQVAIAGNTIIGNGNLVGTNACTIPGMKIGDDNKIAAGMTIYKSVGDNETVIYKHKERVIIKRE